MASDTDDTACHYAKATVGHREGIHMGNCCKQSKYVWQEVNLYIESVVKGRKEPRSPNSVITHGDRWGFHRWCLYLGLGRHPSAQTWLPIFAEFLSLPAASHCPTGVDNECLYPEGAVPQSLQPRGM